MKYTNLKLRFRGHSRRWTVTALVAFAGAVGLCLIKPQIVDAAMQPVNEYTAKTSIQGTPVYVTVVPQGHTVSAAVRKTEPWWKWGNTTSDIYLFAIGQPSNVEMILEFQKNSANVPQATIYGDIVGHKPIAYQWVQTPLEKATNAAPSLEIQSLKGVQSLVMSPTKGLSWFVGGHPNYDLKISSDSHEAQRPPHTEIVTSNGSGVPVWQTSVVSQNPHPTWSYNRFSAAKRMAGAPPFQVQQTFMPTFPYLGIHRGDPNWFIKNANPFYFNIKRMKFTEYSFVGFEEGGIYRLNSVSTPPHLDFESPFAFYNFAPDTRYAQLVVRAQNYNANDPFFNYPTPKDLMTYRYSWSMGTKGVWNYGLTVGGFRSFKNLLYLGNEKFYGVDGTDLPKWTIQHPWGVVTLDQAMHGYYGSEGIYFYSVQSPNMWNWMLGYENKSPSFLSHPKLPNKVTLTKTSTMSVPLGFRDEYNADYFKTPTLYASPIDHLMHLKWAAGGIYHFSKKAILKTENLNGGPYIDSWQIDALPTYKPTDEIAYLNGYIIYSGSKGVLIRKSNILQAAMTINPPTDKSTWDQYVNRVRPYQKGNNPAKLYNWAQQFTGVTYQIAHGRVQDLKSTSAGFSFLLTSSSAGGSSKIQGLPIHGGRYMVQYNEATHRWSYEVARAASISGHVNVSGAAKVGYPSKYILSLKNAGNVPWHGAVALLINGKSFLTDQLVIQGGQVWRRKVTWTPESAHAASLKLKSRNQVLWQKTQAIAGTPTQRDSFLFQKGAWSDVSDGILIILLMLLSGGAIGMMTYSFRKAGGGE